MKTYKPLIIIVFTLSVFTISAQEKAFQKANSFYQKGEYSMSIEIYDSLYNANSVSFELLYNLGNSYYKKDAIAKAILFYERAALLQPNNIDLQHNLKLANSRISDQIEPLPEFYFKTLNRKFINLFSESEWMWINISFWILFFAVLWFFVISTNLTRKKMLFYSMTFLILTVIISGYGGYKNYQQSTSQNTAIIMTPTVNIKSSPDVNSTTLFVLHSGAKIKIKEKIGNWYEITIANGNQGWILSDDFEKI